MTLREGWWSQSDHAEIDLTQPGIYEWRLEEVGVYIGKSCRLRKRILEYPNNVRKLSIGAPYRKGAPLGFRDIHRGLKLAHDNLNGVVVSILENCSRCDLNAREQHWINVRQHEAVNGGLRVLNSTLGGRTSG